MVQSMSCLEELFTPPLKEVTALTGTCARGMGAVALWPSVSAVEITIPRISPIAQPVRQWSVAETAVLHPLSGDACSEGPCCMVDTYPRPPLAEERNSNDTVTPPVRGLTPFQRQQGLFCSPLLRIPKNHGRLGLPYCANRPKSFTV